MAEGTGSGPVILLPPPSTYSLPSETWAASQSIMVTRTEREVIGWRGGSDADRRLRVRTRAPTRFTGRTCARGGCPCAATPPPSPGTSTNSPQNDCPSCGSCGTPVGPGWTWGRGASGAVVRTGLDVGKGCVRCRRPDQVGRSAVDDLLSGTTSGPEAPCWPWPPVSHHRTRLRHPMDEWSTGSLRPWSSEDCGTTSTGGHWPPPSTAWGSPRGCLLYTSDAA